MAEIPKDLRFIPFGRGARHHAPVAFVMGFLVMGCFIVGIVGDAANKVPSLEPTNWFLLAIVLCVMGFWAWLTAYFTAKEA